MQYFLLWKDLFYSLYMDILFACKYVHHMHACWISQNWGYVWLWATIWVQRIGIRSPTKATISPTFYILKLTYQTPFWQPFPQLTKNHNCIEPLLMGQIFKSFIYCVWNEHSLNFVCALMSNFHSCSKLLLLMHLQWYYKLYCSYIIIQMSILDE